MPFSAWRLEHQGHTCIFGACCSLGLQRGRLSVAYQMLAWPSNTGHQMRAAATVLIMVAAWRLHGCHMLNNTPWLSCLSAQSEGAASSQTSEDSVQGPTGHPSMLALQEIEAAVPDASKKDIGRAYKAVVTLLQKENKVLLPVSDTQQHAAASLRLHQFAAAPRRCQLRAHTACLSDSQLLWYHAACPAKL